MVNCPFFLSLHIQRSKVPQVPSLNVVAAGHWDVGSEVSFGWSHGLKLAPDHLLPRTGHSLRQRGPVVPAFYLSGKPHPAWLSGEAG